VALAEAKRALVSEALSRQGYVDAEEEKAVSNFVLYGDPSLVHHLPSTWAEDAALADRAAGAVELAGPVDTVGTPPVRPHTLAHGASGPEGPAGAAVPAGLVELVQKKLAKRMPELASADVRVAAARVPRSLAAKCADGDGAAGAARIVVTLTKSMPTCEGPCCPEVVRVTVDVHGTIRKVAVSR
jgi:hypothetical protein